MILPKKFLEKITPELVTRTAEELSSFVEEQGLKEETYPKEFQDLAFVTVSSLSEDPKYFLPLTWALLSIGYTLGKEDK